jgi:hypothetical protein
MQKVVDREQGIVSTLGVEHKTNEILLKKVSSLQRKCSNYILQFGLNKSTLYLR